MASVKQVAEVEEDFLEVDNPINGQRYVLLSFVSPNKLLEQKEIFSFHKFLKQRQVQAQQRAEQQAETTTETTTEATTETTTEADANATQTEETTIVAPPLKELHNLTHEQFKKEYGDFMYSHRDNVDSEFNELVDFLFVVS